MIFLGSCIGPFLIQSALSLFFSFRISDLIFRFLDVPSNCECELCDCNFFITAVVLQENTSLGTKQKLRSPLKYQINLANRCDEFRDFHNLSTLTHLVTFELISFQFTCIGDLPQTDIDLFHQKKKIFFFLEVSNPIRFYQREDTQLIINTANQQFLCSNTHY